MDARERYLFDLNGYLVVRDALSAEAVTAIDRLMDERIARDVPAGATTHRFADVLDWGPEVRALIDHERVAPYRTLFLMLDPGPMAYGAAFYDRDRWADLTQRQRAILESPNARYRGRPTA